MIKALVALVALALSCGTAYGQSAFPGPSSFSVAEQDTLFIAQVAAWDSACFLMKMTKECRDIRPPRVGYALLAGDFGNFDGGTRTILVDLRLLGQGTAIAVMVHEMIHYLQDKRDGPDRKLTLKTKCAAEKEAHDLVQDWYKIMDMKPDPRAYPWDKAKILYGCAS